MGEPKWLMSLIVAIFSLYPIVSVANPTNNFNPEVNGDIFYTISLATGSMKPTIYGSKLALVKPEEKDLKISDI